MEIKVKSNRIDFMYFFLPLLIFIVGFILFSVIGQILGYNNITDHLISFITTTILTIFGFGYWYVKDFYNQEIYIFGKKNIQVFKKNKLINNIEVTDIELMYYYPFKVRYIISMLLSNIPDGGVMKIRLTKNDGSKHTFKNISKKDAYLIQLIYPSKFIIYQDYETNI